MAKALVFKKNPIIIVSSFIALQFAVAAVYFLLASLEDYGELWEATSAARFIEFSVAQTGLIFVTEIVLILYMFFTWYRQSVKLTADQLVFSRGVLVRSHTIVPYTRIATATFRQGILGKLTHYGAVDVCDSRGSLLVRLVGMSEPQEFIDELVQRKGKLAIDEDADPGEMLTMPEHERLERKSTFRWDLKTASVNKSLEKAAMKTVAAFLNSGGGHLILGVGDKGEPVGLESDYGSLQRRDADGFQNHFTNVLSSMLGPSLRRHVRLQPFTHEGKECMLVAVGASDRPAYLRDAEHEEFFIRTGNGTTSLRMSEANAYINERFKSKS